VDKADLFFPIIYIVFFCLVWKVDGVKAAAWVIAFSLVINAAVYGLAWLLGV